MKKTKVESHSNPKTQNKSSKGSVKGKIDSIEHKISGQPSGRLTKSQESNETPITAHKDITSHEVNHNRLCHLSDSDSLTKQGIEGIEDSLTNTPELRNISTLCPIQSTQAENFKLSKCDNKKHNFDSVKIDKEKLFAMQRELDIIKPARISFSHLPTEGAFQGNGQESSKKNKQALPRRIHPCGHLQFFIRARALKSQALFL